MVSAAMTIAKVELCDLTAPGPAPCDVPVVRGLLSAPLGASWVVISGVISPPIWLISIVTQLITPLRTTHEPPSGRGRPGLLSTSLLGHSERYPHFQKLNCCHGGRLGTTLHPGPKH